MNSESILLLVHFGDRIVFVVAGLLCLWLGYRLLGATTEFTKWSEQAMTNARSAIDTLKRAITEAKQTFERISEAEKKARSEKDDFNQTIERVTGAKLEEISRDINASTGEAKYGLSRLDRELQSVDKWKGDLAKTLDEMHEKIATMEESTPKAVLEILDRRLNLGRHSSAVLAVIGTLLLVFAAFGVFHA